MRDTRDLILDASLEVFTEKGYTSATTLDISKKAGVSEMTLFRHFKTKDNLFILSIKKAMGTSIDKDLKPHLELSLSDFISELLDEKLTIISSQIDVIKMLIRETLSHKLPEDLAFPKIISNQVIYKISLYVKHHHLDMDPISFGQMIVGLLLRYAIMEERPVYHQLGYDEKMKYLKSYLDILNTQGE
ncbi:TetR/AcrR family transcriptional regulator [Mariniplasma anaerobium]|uniref:AcrR family transcriptional regulator n=1 Tax=Mariniplasma anaerobium TaxID=2735436 RepID=A0A7R7ZFU7_9MOLU|nr:TetR/AcrR family transcriptional regulator [Mariniplasma anaerobium]BCR36685.1 AcrR family transcriptional regulator [Mariniplasma anaerobium]